MFRIKLFVTLLMGIFLTIPLFATKESASSQTPSNISSAEGFPEIETLLRLSNEELEKAGDKLNFDQKAALKKLAFNTKLELQIRWRALVMAARLLGAEASPEIKAASKSSDWFMRSAAMVAAGEISTEQGAEMARRMIKDKALVVRSAAVDILGTSGEASDRELLWKIIKDPINKRRGQSLWIRSQALQILAKSPLKSETESFVSLLKENDLELQAISINALERTSEFQFGSENESIEEHKNRWLNWWDLNKKSKSL